MNAVRIPTMMSMIGFFFLASHIARKIADRSMAQGQKAGGD
jgi:hypothetical protein